MSAQQAISVAVVGHTNTGKTSLIRTLLRSDKFGDVANASGTTRHVEQAALMVDGVQLVKLFDTPGLEDASTLLQELLKPGDAHALSDSLTKFIAEAESHLEFDQEIKVLRQGVKSDALLYVIDVRLPAIEKYRDEIQILGALGKPIIPVFNFIVEEEQGLEEWRDMMISQNLHAALEFDTVAFDFEAEKRLYQKLQGVLEPHYDVFQTLIDERAETWRRLRDAGVKRAVQLISECAVHRTSVKSNEEQERREQLGKLQAYVRKREEKCLRDQLRMFQFSKTELEIVQLPVSEGSWDMDLFSLDTLKMFGLDARSSALKGAAAGAGIDLMVGGLTLGTATALGALIGAGYSTFKRYGSEIAAAVKSEGWACVDEQTLELLYLRQQDLLARLMHRGHAAQSNLKVEDDDGDTSAAPENWKDIVEGLRSGQVSEEDSNTRFTEARQELADALTASLN